MPFTCSLLVLIFLRSIPCKSFDNASLSDNDYHYHLYNTLLFGLCQEFCIKLKKIFCKTRTGHGISRGNRVLRRRELPSTANAKYSRLKYAKRSRRLSRNLFQPVFLMLSCFLFGDVGNGNPSQLVVPKIILVNRFPLLPCSDKVYLKLDNVAFGDGECDSTDAVYRPAGA